MKRLDELGVSPAPWALKRMGMTLRGVVDSAGVVISENIRFTPQVPNCRLMAAAPDLYEALRDAYFEAYMDHCYTCDFFCGTGPGSGWKCGRADGECFFHKWHKALEKAGGAK